MAYEKRRRRRRRRSVISGESWRRSRRRGGGIGGGVSVIEAGEKLWRKGSVAAKMAIMASAAAKTAQKRLAKIAAKASANGENRHGVKRHGAVA